MNTVDSRRLGARVTAGVALVLLASAALAQPSQEQIGAVKANCRSDFMAHCMSVRPGTKEALQCLQQHIHQLSGACKSAVSATMPPPAAAAPSQPAAPKAAEAPTNAPAPPAKSASAPPSPAPAANPPAHPAARKAAASKPKPVKRASAPAAPPATAAAPSPAVEERGPVRGGLLIDKACARTIVMHCRGFGLDNRRKVACLVDYVRGGHFVGPRCKGVLEMTGHL